MTAGGAGPGRAAQFAPLVRVLREHGGVLLLTYALFALEMLGMLLRPFFLGHAVDGLLDGTYAGLVTLAVAHLATLVVGTVRQMYDTRAYSAIYTTFVTRLLERDGAARDVSKLSAHSTLARQFVDFLEFDFGYVIEAIYHIFGALVMLFLYERTVVAICLVILVPVSRLSWRYGQRTARLNRAANDELEKQVDIIAAGDPVRVRDHYLSLRRWQIKLSDQEAWNFGAMELLVLVVIVLALLVSTDITSENQQAGSIIGIYNYILMFTSGLDTIPHTMQRLGQLKDIMRRMELERLAV